MAFVRFGLSSLLLAATSKMGVMAANTVPDFVVISTYSDAECSTPYAAVYFVADYCVGSSTDTVSVSRKYVTSGDSVTSYMYLTSDCTGTSSSSTTTLDTCSSFSKMIVTTVDRYMWGRSYSTSDCSGAYMETATALTSAALSGGSASYDSSTGKITMNGASSTLLACTASGDIQAMVTEVVWDGTTYNTQPDDADLAVGAPPATLFISALVSVAMGAFMF
eukprot:CAMPEP_0206600696 /NCGR_PEP_ID=MMETSP0325_2-20121206/46008_1 /ASSEMBLY_ACC=CAM_ASM_000347 /TAXON_ID=2866 /ORGANISM="Crypthecodinium cohnii, Strain Seligo" /LENGTH=220 /DNA_ID=CAMNT_0054112167 /DNA_START=71 /DNA_END=734 /DNA_ORIENTATION=+